jgi:pimeloyl-ACP methyl ester carboxylesterase
LIVPNRPGYGRTSLGRKGCARYCADLAAALLDHLSIERAVVVGKSGGGMPAACFARYHPRRTAGLVLQCAQSHRWNDDSWLPEGLESTLFYFRHRIFLPLLRWQNLRYMKAAHRHPIACLRRMSGNRFPEIRDDPDPIRQITELTKLSLPCGVAPAGVQNDWSILVGDNGVEPESISRPTLIIHDRADPVVRFRHAEWSHSCIAGSRLLEVHAGGLWIWFGRDAALVQAERLAFVRKCFQA